MATVGNLVINIAANTVSLEQGVKKSSRLVEDLNKTIGSLGLGAIGAGAAFAGFGKFMSDSVSAAREAEKIQADLNATLQSTKFAAGLTADEINAMAESLSLITRFEDDSIVKGQAMLLTFTNIGKDVFPQATEAMLNMAEKFGSMDSAAVQLGKALNDPIQGVTALRRVGVQLTDEQEEQIKTFVKAGNVAAAQRVILGELETEFGGLARAIGETSEGELEIFKNKLGNTQEAIGTGLLPVLNEMTIRFDRLFTPLSQSNDELSKFTEYFAKFEATPFLTTLDHAAFVLEQFNGVVKFCNDLLEGTAEQLGLAKSWTDQTAKSFQAATLPIVFLTQGPLAGLRAALQVIKDLWESLNSLISQVSTLGVGGFAAQLRGEASGIARYLGIPGFQSGGVVPGQIGAPQLAVVHGGEMVLPAGSWNTHHTFEFRGNFDQGMREMVMRVMADVLAQYARSR